MAKLTGTNPDQVPTNADLGTMAYQDKDNVKVGGGKVTGDITVQDNKKIYFGTDNDMNIGHGGANGSINNTTGNIGYNSNQHIFGDVYGTERMRITSNGNVGIGDQNPDSHYGAEHRLVVRENQDGPTQAVVTNSNVSGSASSVYKWITGTGNSYMTHTLHDGNGTPFARLSMGTAVINYDIFIDNTQAFLIRGSNKEVVIPSGKLELDGNDIGGTQVTIADDAVASITPPRTGGFMMITAQGNTDYPQSGASGFLFYDVGLSLQMSEQSFNGGGANLDATTSDVTGTTGTDGNITVAAQSGVIKIENRYGSSTTFSVTFL
jgi:hypothetical protein